MCARGSLAGTYQHTKPLMDAHDQAMTVFAMKEAARERDELRRQLAEMTRKCDYYRRANADAVKLCDRYNAERINLFRRVNRLERELEAANEKGSR